MAGTDSLQRGHQVAQKMRSTGFFPMNGLRAPRPPPASGRVKSIHFPSPPEAAWSGAAPRLPVRSAVRPAAVRTMRTRAAAANPTRLISFPLPPSPEQFPRFHQEVSSHEDQEEPEPLLDDFRPLPRFRQGGPQAPGPPH